MNNDRPITDNDNDRLPALPSEITSEIVKQHRTETTLWVEDTHTNSVTQAPYWRKHPTTLHPTLTATTSHGECHGESGNSFDFWPCTYNHTTIRPYDPAHTTLHIRPWPRPIINMSGTFVQCPCVLQVGCIAEINDWKRKVRSPPFVTSSSVGSQKPITQVYLSHKCRCPDVPM